MKATLTHDQVFTLHIGDVKFAGMQLVSQWECFLKLRNEGGESVILFDERGPTRRTLDSAFDTIFDPKPAEYVVMVASPRLLAEIQNGAATPEASTKPE